LFIQLNLDTNLEDSKFWMAHELAHVHTPDLAGNEESENFADAFDSALLFPAELPLQPMRRCLVGIKRMSQRHCKPLQLSMAFHSLVFSANSTGLRKPAARHF
jgi:Zn-dependent peptidase ImmA (M78 family)